MRACAASQCMMLSYALIAPLWYVVQLNSWLASSLANTVMPPCCLRTQQCFVTPVMKDLRHTAVTTVEKQVAQCMRMQPSTAKSKSR